MPRSPEDYLRDILHAARTIIARTRGLTEDQFFANPVLVESVLYNLIAIGEASNHLPPGVRARRPDVEWDVIIAMRNRIVHGYWDVNPTVIWETVHTNIPQLEAQIETLLIDLEEDRN